MHNTIRSLVLAALLAGSVLSAQAFNFKGGDNAIQNARRVVGGQQIYDVPSKGEISAAFSPDGGSEALVVKVIDSAAAVPQGEILMLAYSFTSPAVTEALIRAAHRGVRITLVADYKNNLVDDKSGKPRAAFAALKSAGADVRTIKAFAIHHDKVIIANRKTVELGSFNYSSAAAQRNSENVLVHWNNPELASVYLKHFERNYGLSEAFSAAY